MSSLTKNVLRNFHFVRSCTCKRFTFHCEQNRSSENKLSCVKPKIEPRISGNRTYFSFPNLQLSFLNMTVNLKKKVRDIFKSSQRKYFGFLWYESLEEVDILEFFSLLQMPDTFYSRFRIIALHVWMLLYHLPKEFRSDSLVRYGLIQAMWEDTEQRAKILAPLNVNYRKNLILMHENFKICLMYYDFGFSTNDMILCSALWYNFFDGKDVDPRILETLVSFVRHQMNHLNKLNLRMLTEKEEKTGVWLPLRPHYNKVFKIP